MDPVTHLAAGLLTAQALEPDRRKRWPLTLLCGVAATIPDIDAATGYFGLESYLRHHRGITHSVFVLPFFALLLAWAARRSGARLTLARAWTAAALALATHIFLDVVTAFGTQALLPFSDARVSFEGVFVVDPAFTLALFACVLLGRGLPSPALASAGASRRTYALAGLALLVCYPLVGNLLRLNVQQRYETLLHKRLASYEQVTATPDALAPWYWKIVVRRGGELTVTTAELPDVSRPHPSVTLRHVPRQELIDLGRSASIFGTYAWFAEHPASYLGPQALPQDVSLPIPPGGRAVRYVDALFLNTGPVLAAISGHRTPFSELTAIEDGNGRLLAWLDDKGRAHPVAAP